MVTTERKEIVRIGYEDVEVYPDFCLREARNCQQCHFQGKIACRPQFRQGLKPFKDINIDGLLKSGKTPMEVHKITGVNINTIYHKGQMLRHKGELERLLNPHPKEQRNAIIAYVKEHPNEMYTDIAERFNVEPSYISRTCSKAGIHRRNYIEKQKDTLTKTAISILENTSRSITSVAEELGIAPTTLQSRIRKQGKLPLNHEARVFLEAVRKEVIAAVLEAFSILKKERIIIVDRTTEKEDKR